MKTNKRILMAGAGAFAAIVAQTATAAAQSAPYVVPEITVVTQDGDAVTASNGSVDAAVIRKYKASASSIPAVLQSVPGMSMQAAGGVSPIPVMRGFNDDRLLQTVNGTAITSACANHMNPPMSYADPNQVEEIKISLPVSGVSEGGDSTGGSISVVTLKPKFTSTPDAADKTAANSNVVSDKYSGEVHGGFRSNGKIVTAGGRASIQNDWASLSYAGNWVKGENYEDGHGDEVLSTSFESFNHEVALGLKGDLGLTTLRGHLQRIPEQAYVNQRMDMMYNNAWGISAEQQTETGLGTLNALAFYNHVRHNMNFLDDKLFLGTMTARNMPMDTRGNDFGYKLSLDHKLTDGSTLKVGNELHRQTLDEWWPPVTGKPGMCCNTYELINGGERTRLGTFIELDKKLSDALSLVAGLRNDVVWMNTGDVQGYNVNPMMGYGADAAAFNAKDHSKTDINFDATALLRYDTGGGLKLEGGYARKTRSPNFYERYAWSAANTMPGQMSKNMIGWFGDGNGYIGNLNLDPEVAHNLSLTASLSGEDKQAWSLSVSPYYSYVHDYIGVTKINNSTTPGGFTNLRFVNHDAALYGFDAWGQLRLAQDTRVGDIGLSGSVSYVRGKNLDSHGDLYHMMPFNGRVAIEQKSESWSNSLGLQFVTAKTKVDADRAELTTKGYALLDFRSSWEHGNFRLDFGVENILDTAYDLPLGGVNIPETFLGHPRSSVAGAGRNFFVSGSFKF